MKKIGIITTSHPVFDVRIFEKQARTLAKNQYEVFLLARYHEMKTIDQVQIIPLPVLKNRWLRLLFLPFFAIGQALKLNCNLYHIHDPELLMPGLILKWISRKKIIYDVHEDHGLTIATKAWIPFFLRRPLQILFQFLEKKIALFYDGIITVTDSIEKKFQNKNSIQIRNYPNLSFFKNDQPKPSLTRDLYQLIYAGSLAPERGIVEIINALSYIRHPVQLTIFGNFSSPQFEKKIRSLENFKFVAYHHWAKNNIVVTQLQKSDIGLVCLLPLDRYKEAIPVKLFEYMASGLPVIASNFKQWQPFVLEEKCGLMVDPLDCRQIARAVDYLLSHPGIRAQMIDQGKKAVRQKYNWQQEEKKLLCFYSQLIESNY